MDLIVMILAAMSGALIGSSTGIFLMYRRLRPVNAVELDALRSKVRTTEFDLNAAIANSARLKKEAAEQASKVSDEAMEKQKQLEAALAARDLEAAHRNAAEQRIAELIAEADAGKARHAETEAKAKELEAKAAELEARGAGSLSPASEEQQRQLAALQEQVEGGGRRIQELTEQATRLTAEAAEFKQRSDEAGKTRTALEAELKQRSEEALKAREALEAELQQRSDEALKARVALEADLTSERERLQVLTEQVSELRNELSAQEIRMQEERESAAKGMELLVMAQQNLSRVIQAAATEAPVANGANGTNGHSAAAPEVAAANGNSGTSESAPAKAMELQSAAVQ
jgi:chromosome segregation ATPase